MQYPGKLNPETLQRDSIVETEMKRRFVTLRIIKLSNLFIVPVAPHGTERELADLLRVIIICAFCYDCVVIRLSCIIDRARRPIMES